MAHGPATKRSIGWMGLRRGHRAKPFEWLAERVIMLVSLTAILMVFLIFVFIGREAWPVAIGRVNTALVQQMRPVSDINKMTPLEFCDYLGLSTAQLASMDRETLERCLRRF